jgi:hypothetical protein
MAQSNAWGEIAARKDSFEAVRDLRLIWRAPCEGVLQRNHVSNPHGTQSEEREKIPLTATMVVA